MSVILLWSNCASQNAGTSWDLWRRKLAYECVVVQLFPTIRRVRTGFFMKFVSSPVETAVQHLLEQMLGSHSLGPAFWPIQRCKQSWRGFSRYFFVPALENFNGRTSFWHNWQTQRSLISSYKRHSGWCLLRCLEISLETTYWRRSTLFWNFLFYWSYQYIFFKSTLLVGQTLYNSYDIKSTRYPRM